MFSSSNNCVVKSSVPRVKIVVSRQLHYHSLCIDLRRSFSVHSVDHTPCILDPSLGIDNQDCQAVHRGLCEPLEKPLFINYSTCSLDNLSLKSEPRVASTDSFFDKIQAAIELLADEGEPQNLEHFLRNFVKEDRKRQQNKNISKNVELDTHQNTELPQNSLPSQSAPNNHSTQNRDPSPSGRIIKIRQPSPSKESVEDKKLSNEVDNISWTTSSSHFQSRLSRFEQNKQDKPKFDGIAVDREKLVFGLSSKSSLTRHKHLIENRNSPSPPPPEDENASDKKAKLIRDTPFLAKNIPRNNSSDNTASLLSSKSLDPNQRVLTDDEKVFIQKSSESTKQLKSSNEDSNLNKNNDVDSIQEASCSKVKRRIIVVPKPTPAPKPELLVKPTPKCVKGKLIFGQSPVKPLISSGSVAERVLLFERCPPERVKQSRTNLKSDYKNLASRHFSVSSSNWNQNQNSLTYQSNSTHLKRRTSNTSTGIIPKFYYPRGHPFSSQEIANQMDRIKEAFNRFPGRQASRKEFTSILRFIGLPVYWKEPLFQALTTSDLSNNNNISDNNKKTVISCEIFLEYWKRLISNCFDEATRFIAVLTCGQRNYLIPEDFASMVQDVIDSHPGLSFLKEAIEFHSRYIATVIARIFFNVNRSWSGKITLPELRTSNLLQILRLLEEEDDINQITEYFSYEHFYVIYCKFWELDKDHDLFIDKYDLSKHSDGAISSRMIDRIFSGAVTHCRDSRMSYSEFVWFLLAEEDKRHPRSIEYWFRAMDLDGDGFLSFYELEYFYSEQIRRMEAMGIESLPFNDCLCQMLDLVRPKVPGKITLADLKKCALTSIFFDTFFNLDKYLQHEQRDPFATNRDDELQMSDWERFAAEEYEFLVAEESVQSGNPTNSCKVSNVGEINSKQYGQHTFIDDHKDDDDYDYVDPGSD